MTSPPASHVSTMSDLSNQRTRSLSFADRSDSSLSSSAGVTTPSMNKRRQCATNYLFRQDNASMAIDLSIASPDSLRSITSASTSEDNVTSPWNSSPDIHNTTLRVVSSDVARAMSRHARHENDMMVYLEGPSIYACSECGTHLSSHDDIISKSFHGRHGRAFLLESCVNVNIGPAEDRRLLTGLHSVCDLNCKRCNSLVGWTYKRAYDHSQKYKEGKFIIEKVYLSMLEDSKPFQGSAPRIRQNSWSHRSSSSRGKRPANIDMQRPSPFSFSSAQTSDPNYL